MGRWVAVLLACLVAGPVWAQSYLPDSSAIIQDARRTEWRNTAAVTGAGLDNVSGGIPTYTSVACTGIVTLTTDGSVNEAADIQTCLNAMSPGQAALLPAGTLLVSAATINIPTNVVLRGAGSGFPWMTHALLASNHAAGATTLTLACRTPCLKTGSSPTVDFPASGAAFLGTDRFTYTGKTSTTLTGVSGFGGGSTNGVVNPDACQGQAEQTCLLLVTSTITMDGGGRTSHESPIAITSGRTKHSTSLTFASAALISSISAGDFISIYEPNDLTIMDQGDASAFACEDDPAETPDAANCIQQYAEVTAKAGAVLTIKQPIAWACTVAAGCGGVSAGSIKRAPFGRVKSGLENIKLQGNFQTTNTAMSQTVLIEFCQNCWVKNVALYGAPHHSSDTAAIRIKFSFGAEVRDNRFSGHNGSNTAGLNYHMAMVNWNSHHKIENNLGFEGRHAWQIEGACPGCVVLYNHSDYNFEQTSVGGSPSTGISHDCGIHMHFSFMTLHEGNSCAHLRVDVVHGNGAYNTFFRNHGRGVRTAPTISSVIGAITVGPLHRYYNLIGNVAGSDTSTTGWSGTTGTNMTICTAGSTSRPIGLAIGVNSSGTCASADGTEFTTMDAGTDNTCSNYSYGGTNGLANTAGTTYTCALAIPDSLYYPSRPTGVFGLAANAPAGVSWPPFGPTPTVTTLPALHCFNQNKMPNCLAAAGAGTVTDTTATSSTSPANTAHTVLLPATLVAGNVLLCGFCNDTSATTTTPTGWTKRFDQVLAFNTGRLSIYDRLSNGAEGASISITTSASRTSASVCYELSDTADPVLRPPTISTMALGQSSAPDSPIVSPTDGNLAYKFMSMACLVGGGLTATVPSSYGSLLSQDAGGATPQIISAERDVVALSEDPGVWALTGGSVRWGAVTLAIQPDEPPPPEVPFIASTSMTCATCTTVTSRVWAGQALKITGVDFGTNTGSARVVITDDAAWPNGVQVNQTITAWADTEITITATQGAHTTLDGMWLYVVNSSDVATIAGFRLFLAPQCANGVDDDSDTLIDAANDTTGCIDTEDDDETSPAAPSGLTIILF